jgi:hypothetical protein
MKSKLTILAALAAGFACGAATIVIAQTTRALPDPSHIVLMLPKDVVWHKNPLELGEWQAPLFGDPAKPGPYGILIKWETGHHSFPHTHSTDRFAYVIKGNWWVSSSKVFDSKTQYPVPAGSFVEDIADTIHWDGAIGKPVTLIMFGNGPVVTTRLPHDPDPAADKIPLLTTPPN